MGLTELKQNLEFDKILDHIGGKCVSDLGKSRLLNSTPFYIQKDLDLELKKVDEIKSIFISESGLPIWSFIDIRPLLNKIEPLESHLDPQECQQVQNLLELVSEIDKFIIKQENKYPVITNLASDLDDLSNLRKLIFNTIEPSGAIYDNASPELKRIRHDINNISKQINIKLDRILKKQSDHLQENYVTLREGRLVLPVREFSVNKVPGIVHGQSATGQTHFVEPFAVVTLNNQMHELYMQEKKEIILILKRLSDVIRENGPQLLINQNILIQLDVLQAKAKYALAVNGVAPKIHADFVWEFNQGYHPLLLKKMSKDAIPLSLSLGEDKRILIISGPNAGGKTVTLKTVGLLQLLFQSGFHIPVAEKSKFPICAEIFAVIGDEQSIEDDLSTFSSHIKKLNDIVNKATNRSLILIDEIGTGTDPSEGAALAIAVLEELNRDEIVTLVTTHHGELKVFAHKMAQVHNAAMQFDRQTLAPKFKMEFGIPGSSYAFDISRRLGVNSNVLDRAKEILGTSHHELEEMILELSDIKQQYQDQLSSISLKETELNGMQALYRTRSDELKKKKKHFEKDALQEARDVLDRVNKTIESVIREIRESGADREVIKNGRKKITQLKSEVTKKLSGERKTILHSIDEFKVGIMVRSQRFGVKGQVSKVFSDKNEIEIETNGMKMIVPLNDLIISQSTDQNSELIKDVIAISKPIIYELDVRGMIADDAIMELERYLDAAIQSDWQEVRVIHGKGTGILRQNIHSYLKKNKHIKTYRLGNIGEGDTGVTVISL